MPADDVVVARLDGGLVVLPVWPAPGLFHVDGLQVADEVQVDELAAVVVVVGADGERQALLDHGLGLGEVPVRVVPGGSVLGPSGGEVDDGQGAAELSLEAGPAMGDGVGLHVAGQAVELVACLPDRNRVAQQLARRAGGRHALGVGGVAHGLEVSVHRGRAHREQFVDRRRVESPQLAGLEQRRNPLGQHLLHVFRARQVHQQPYLFQQEAGPVRIPFRPFARGFAALACAAGFLESAPGGAPAYLQRLAHAVEDDALVLFRCLRVFILEPEGYLPFGGHADPVFHGTSQAGGMGFALTPGEAPLHFSRSKNVMHVAFVKSKRAIRYDWAVAATLATVSFLSIIAMHSFDLPIDRLRLPWALDILPFSMLFYCIGYLLSRFLMPYMQKSKPKASLHAVYAAIGMAGLGLLRVFDELTRLSVNLNDASTSNPFWMLCAALLGFISSLMLCVAIDCRLLQFLGRASLTIMCVHEPVKRVLIFVMAKILGMNTDALRANLVYAMLVTVVTVAICVAVHLIMDRFAPMLIGSSRHNLASQGEARA